MHGIICIKLYHSCTAGLLSSDYQLFEYSKWVVQAAFIHQYNSSVCIRSLRELTFLLLPKLLCLLHFWWPFQFSRCSIEGVSSKGKVIKLSKTTGWVWCGILPWPSVVVFVSLYFPSSSGEMGRVIFDFYHSLYDFSA